MSDYDRKTHLQQVHEQRRKKTNERVDKAIKRLLLAQEPINFNSVAKESGVSKATLYNHDTCLLYTSWSKKRSCHFLFISTMS